MTRGMCTSSVRLPCTAVTAQQYNRRGGTRATTHGAKQTGGREPETGQPPSRSSRTTNANAKHENITRLVAVAKATGCSTATICSARRKERQEELLCKIKELVAVRLLRCFLARQDSEPRAQLHIKSSAARDGRKRKQSQSRAAKCTT